MNKLTLILSMLFLSQLAQATRESDFLIRTLLSRQDNHQVRAAAAKSLSQFGTESNTIRVLLTVARDAGNETSVRIEAVKALSDEAINLRTSRELISIYHRESDVTLKSWIVKSIYQSAENMEIRTFLENILLTESSEELQKAAAFALMIPAANPNNTSGIFIRMLQDNRTSDAVKVEIIKSLFLNTQRNVHDLLVRMAMDRSENSMVRAACLKVFQSAIHANGNRVNFLSMIATTDPVVEVRKAAILALRPRLDESDISWFHLRNHPYSNLKRNPLED